MNPRIAVTLLFALALFIAIGGILATPSYAWQYINIGQQLTMAFSVILGFGFLLIAYWAWQDDQRLTKLEQIYKENKPLNWNPQTHSQSTTTQKTEAPTTKTEEQTKQLLARYSTQTIWPQIMLNEKIKTKTQNTNKTREQAIEELYNET